MPTISPPSYLPCGAGGAGPRREIAERAVDYKGIGNIDWRGEADLIGIRI
jgi:hypothetical protein